MLKKNYDETEKLNYYTSSDLGCSASLLASGFRLLTVDKSNPRRASFCFQKTPELERAITDYWNDNLLISARVLLEAVKSLKNRIYGE